MAAHFFLFLWIFISAFYFFSFVHLSINRGLFTTYYQMENRINDLLIFIGLLFIYSVFAVFSYLFFDLSHFTARFWGIIDSKVEVILFLYSTVLVDLFYFKGEFRLRRKVKWGCFFLIAANVVFLPLAYFWENLFFIMGLVECFSIIFYLASFLFFLFLKTAAVFSAKIISLFYSFVLFYYCYLLIKHWRFHMDSFYSFVLAVIPIFIFFFYYFSDIKNRSILSDREKKIILGVQQGLSNQEISRTLCISESTVKNALNVIYKRLGISNRQELMNFTEYYRE